MADQKRVTVEDATLIWTNFAGKEDRFNKEGDRNFTLILPDDVGRQMEEDGWNVKWLEPRDEGDVARPTVQVAVSFKVKPPRITMISSAGRTHVTESMVEILDYADIANIDLIITGYDWEVNDKTGTKAYLKTMFVTVNEDELELKYAQIHPEG